MVPNITSPERQKRKEAMTRSPIAPAGPRPLMQAAAKYFGVVFGAGFVFGVLRGRLLVPMVGERTAELIESPLMLAVMVVAARWVAANYAGTARELIAVGAIAAVLVLGGDLLVGTLLRDLSITEILLERDPVSGTVYYLLICVFAALPYLFGRAGVFRK